MRRAMIALPLLLIAAGAVAQAPRPLPYWAALAAGDAMMRTGPGKEYPAVWRYRRVGLPLKVVAVHTSWRKVREMDGTEGWMASVLLTEDRTAMVTGEVRSLRAAPDDAAKVLWRAEPGVVGRVSQCRSGWCRLDVRGRAGFVEASGLWGVDAGETVE
ncbi:SH3 domain-containing protein [Sphingomonas jatrophae]|uniref:SH3-like domain-containing protein n=1 Tax=Sphingomonas jatrophae TaxID=1166337 RepID=A0A1I6JCV3_9SPHN|nr:SH3 domain-containing protein [Sphingomonas jatrophae]SFR76769.1 SH3-like domain-containing protein [Sphingomonas jatrophae]